jgi:thioredoxin reductase (NADPH)
MRRGSLWLGARVKTAAAWDCVIVGGGPAGLSAAIYMGRFLRRTLVVDDAQGRWSYGQTNENYLGFPQGVSARRLQSLGSAQARRFGVSFECATATLLRAASHGFRLETTRGELTARTVIWAAGVADEWPDFKEARRLVGKRLFWCIVCDGWRTLDKDVLLFARNDAAARTALQFLTYTARVTFLVDPVQSRVTSRAREKLIAQGIDVRTAQVRSARTLEEGVEISLDDGTTSRFDYLFSLLGAHPRTAALAALDVKRSRLGHLAVDDKNRTSLPRLFAAGDVSDRHSHQVASAVHEGATAAQSANHALYPTSQKLG